MSFVGSIPQPIRRFAKYLPKPVKQPIRAVVHFVVTIPYWGTGRYCPVCGKASKKFGAYGAVLRDDVQCMHCGSLERHRLVWLYCQRMTDLFDGRPKKLLHVAPEPALEKRLRQNFGANYITADLYDPTVMVKMDITDIQYPDNTFDVIYCSHVLEHVSDDRQAMREFNRTLKPDGWAILLVPVLAETTFEDPSIVDPARRLAVYGQGDHVRIYGPDYVDRLREAGFEVKVTYASDFLSNEEIDSMSLETAGEIYYCTKRGTAHETV